MARPDDIPQDVWDAALAVSPVTDPPILREAFAEVAARAIVDERWRCWGIAHKVSEQLGFPSIGNEIANVIVADIAPVANAKSRAVPAIAGGHQ